MKVLQVCHDFPEAVGGGATHVHRLSRELVRLGNEVTVFTTDLIGKNKRSEHALDQMDGIQVRRFHATTITPIGLDVGNIPFGMLPPLLRTNDWDVIHVHSYRFFSTWVVPLVRWFKPRVPIVMTSHCAYLPARPKRMEVFDSTWGRLVFKDVTKVIALTDIEKDYLGTLGCSQDKIEVIPNGVDSHLLDYVPDVQGFRTKFNLTQARMALFVGRIGLGKGLDILVEAIPLVLAQLGKDVVFVFVGPDWGDRGALEERARALGVEDHLKFTGPLAGETLLDAYHSCDLFVLLSRFDASPLVVVEAMAAAKPVVATRVGGVPNIVHDDATGLLVDPEDAPGAAAAIVRVLKDTNLAQRLGNAGKAMVQERYQWNQIAGQVANLYCESLNLNKP